MIICSRAVKSWDEELKEAIRVRREAYARYTSKKLRQDGRSMLRPEIK